MDVLTFPLLTAYASFDAVILGAGIFPSHEVSLGVLRRAAYLCCCDGAAAAAIRREFTPQAIVGDGDSLTPHLRRRWADRLFLETEQDDNDQTKATRHCLALGYKRLAYVGATGRREDHTLGNIALMAHYHRAMGVEPTLITDYGYLRVATGSARFDTFARQQVSVFNISCTTLSGTGLKWQLRPFAQLWQGTLNEATGPLVSIEGNGLYMVYQTYQPKHPCSSLQA